MTVMDLRERTVSADPEAWSYAPKDAKPPDDGRCRVCDCALRPGEDGVCRDDEGEPIGDVSLTYKLVDVPVIYGKATLPDGRIVESTARIVRAPVLVL